MYDEELTKYHIRSNKFRDNYCVMIIKWVVCMILSVMCFLGGFASVGLLIIGIGQLINFIITSHLVILILKWIVVLIIAPFLIWLGFYLSDKHKELGAQVAVRTIERNVKSNKDLKEEI